MAATLFFWFVIVPGYIIVFLFIANMIYEIFSGEE